jgi:hypothetical protein
MDSPSKSAICCSIPPILSGEMLSFTVSARKAEISFVIAVISIITFELELRKCMMIGMSGKRQKSFVIFAKRKNRYGLQQRRQAQISYIVLPFLQWRGQMPF